MCVFAGCYHVAFICVTMVTIKVLVMRSNTLDKSELGF